MFSFAAANLDLTLLILCAMAVFGAALVQSSTGQAFGSLAAPIVVMLAPERIPSAMLALGIIVTAIGVMRDRGAIEWREVMPALAGRATGAIIAAASLAIVTPGPWLPGAVGGFVLFGVFLSLYGPRLPITRNTLLGAGFLSGLMATLTTVGAPPLSLLYQHEAASRARATLNAFFMLGMIASFLAVASQGLVLWADIVFAIWMLPALALGYLASRPLIPLIDGLSLRPFILTISVLAALCAIAKSLNAF